MDLWLKNPTWNMRLKKPLEPIRSIYIYIYIHAHLERQGAHVYEAVLTMRHLYIIDNTHYSNPREHDRRHVVASETVCMAIMFLDRRARAEAASTASFDCLNNLKQGRAHWVYGYLDAHQTDRCRRVEPANSIGSHVSLLARSIHMA